MHGRARSSVLVYGIIALTSSPFLPGGPGGPRAPTAPCNEMTEREINIKVEKSFPNCVKNCVDQEYLQTARALQAHQHVLGILEVPIYSQKN